MNTAESWTYVQDDDIFRTPREVDVCPSERRLRNRRRNHLDGLGEMRETYHTLFNTMNTVMQLILLRALSQNGFYDLPPLPNASEHRHVRREKFFKTRRRHSSRPCKVGFSRRR